MPLEIRDAEADDVPSVARLYHAVWHFTQAPLQDRAIAPLRDPAWFEQRLDADGRRLPLVAFLDNQIVGFAIWTSDHLAELFVTPEQQGQGIGSGLLLGAELRMRQQGIRLARLHCLAGNSRARRFFEKNGWILKSFESENIESVDGPKKVASWVMTKQL